MSREYEALKAHGHSPAKAAEIVLDASRGDDFCRRYIALVSAAQGIEARRVETGTGSIEDESPVAKGDAPNLHRRRVIDE